MFSLNPSDTTKFDWHFRVWGIDVRVHPFFWLITFLMASHTNAASVGSWFLACFFSLLVHELGHVLAMRWTGGHGSVLLYGFGGLAIPTLRWQRSVADQVTISFAGPLAGFALATATVAAVVGMGGAVDVATGGIGLPTLRGNVQNLAQVNYPLYFFLHYFVNQLLWVNIYWGLINLLPVLPLDGGSIAKALLSTQPDGLRKSLQLSTVTGAIVAALGLLTGNTWVACMFGIFAYQSWEQIGNRSPYRDGYR